MGFIWKLIHLFDPSAMGKSMNSWLEEKSHEVEEGRNLTFGFEIVRNENMNAAAPEDPAGVSVSVPGGGGAAGGRKGRERKGWSDESMY